MSSRPANLPACPNDNDTNSWCSRRYQNAWRESPWGNNLNKRLFSSGTCVAQFFKSGRQWLCSHALVNSTLSVCHIKKLIVSCFTSGCELVAVFLSFCRTLPLAVINGYSLMRIEISTKNLKRNLNVETFSKRYEENLFLSFVNILFT